MNMNWRKIGIFAAGVLFGTAGIKILTSKDAEKGVYKLYSCGSSGKRLCCEDYDYAAGEYGRYL